MINARKCSKLIYIYVCRHCCLVHFAASCSNWKMTFRKPVATTWKMNENQFRQMFLIPWHMLSHIWVHFGLWRPLFMVKIWFSHIFPASAWSPYQSLFLRKEIEKGLRAVLTVVGKTSTYMKHSCPSDDSRKSLVKLCILYCWVFTVHATRQIQIIGRTETKSLVFF